MPLLIKCGLMLQVDFSPILIQLLLCYIRDKRLPSCLLSLLSMWNHFFARLFPVSQLSAFENLKCRRYYRLYSLQKDMVLTYMVAATVFACGKQDLESFDLWQTPIALRQHASIKQSASLKVGKRCLYFYSTANDWDRHLLSLGIQVDSRQSYLTVYHLERSQNQQYTLISSYFDLMAHCYTSALGIGACLSPWIVFYIAFACHQPTYLSVLRL